MERFEYSVTRHAADAFRETAFFCTDHGDCSLEDVPVDQVTVLEGLLNARGRQGWELVQVIFGKNGLLAFWKRRLADDVVA